MIDSFLLEGVVDLTLLLFLMKSILVGSDFSIHDWVKDGKVYTEWYFSREEYGPEEVNKSE